MPGPGRLLRAIMDYFPALGPALNRAAGTTTTMQKIIELREAKADAAASSWPSVHCKIHATNASPHPGIVLADQQAASRRPAAQPPCSSSKAAMSLLGA